MFAALAGILTKPLLVAASALAVAAFVWMVKQRRLAVKIALAGATILFFSTLSPVADSLLNPLESRYAPLPDDVDLHGMAFVAVLGSSYFYMSNATIAAQLDDEGIMRIVEGIRIARSHGIPLLVSGAGPPGYAAPAVGYARLARALGINESSLIVSATGTNTRAEASAIMQIAGARHFVLVTSASHMPRAMAIFAKAGVVPLPAPTAQRVAWRSFLHWRYWLPSALALRKSELALHEYFGLLQERFNRTRQ
jgi:uncharacterized SAM-binding protein YcdF (DUF218 family)